MPIVKHKQHKCSNCNLAGHNKNTCPQLRLGPLQQIEKEIETTEDVEELAAIYVALSKILEKLKEKFRKKIGGG